MVNYKISVIGEVARPGTFTISNEKVNILEALAMAGDMTVYGLRDDVKLIRENANGKQGNYSFGPEQGGDYSFSLLLFAAE